MSFSGLFTALVTPFDDYGNLDEEGFRRNLAFQKEAKVDGFTVAGTTGEAATLTQKEKERLVKIAREEAKDIPLMVGCSSPSTAQTEEMLKKFTDLGADLALVLAPYCIKPTQEGLLRHFEALSKKSEIPIVVYNNPSRTVVNINVPTLKQIADFPNVVGVKDSTKNLETLTEIIFEIKMLKPEFVVYCGDDALMFPNVALGADGAISGTANLIPLKIQEYFKASLEGETFLAQKLHFELFPLFKALGRETHPIPLKAAMNLCGFAAGNPRLPLTPLSLEYLPQLEAVLEILGLSVTNSI